MPYSVLKYNFQYRTAPHYYYSVVDIIVHVRGYLHKPSWLFTLNFYSWVVYLPSSFMPVCVNCASVMLPLCYRYVQVMLPVCLRYAYERRRYKSYVWEPRHVCMAGARASMLHHRNRVNSDVIFDHNLSNNTIRRLSEGCYDTTPDPAKAIVSTPWTSYEY